MIPEAADLHGSQLPRQADRQANRQGSTQAGRQEREGTREVEGGEKERKQIQEWGRRVGGTGYSGRWTVWWCMVMVVEVVVVVVWWEGR